MLLELTFGQTLLAGWAVAAVMQLLIFVQQVRSNNASAVDVGWSAGIVLIAVLLLAAGPVEGWRGVLVGAMGLAWSLRLALYLFLNRVRGKPEDGRYARMRAAMGKHAHAGFFVFFQVQAAWSVLFAAPFVAAAMAPGAGLRVHDVLGVLIWLVAVGGESLSDRQLARFRAGAANKGRTCREGLWRYSRHPNYFFEWVHWWAYVAIGFGSPYWWVTLAGPVLMFLFLFFVTGIPHTEKQAIASRGDDYRRYQKETSMFFPWFPRKAGA